MPNVISKIATQLPQQTLPPLDHEAGEVLRSLIESSAYVGEVVSLGYSEAILQIHDFHRQQVGGISALCFLLASRINPETTPDPKVEDSSVILLRVMDHADLPNAEEAKRVRVENAQRVSGEVNTKPSLLQIFGMLFLNSRKRRIGQHAHALTGACFFTGRCFSRQDTHLQAI